MTAKLNESQKVAEENIYLKDMYNSVRDRLAKSDQANHSLEQEIEQMNVKMREFMKDREKN